MPLTRALSFGTKTSVNRGEPPPNPLNPGAFRATLRDPEGFGHIGWMIRLSGIFGAEARVPPPGLLNAVFSLGIGRVVQ
ncbi:hypothetical protein ACVWY3_006057 [Bradyrhizobium sp. USDA 4486]